MATEVYLNDDMKLIDVNGNSHKMTKFQVRMIILTGWLSFLSSWIVIILFYTVHPSSVDINPKRFKHKCFIYIFGKKKSLFGFRLIKKGILNKIWKFFIDEINFLKQTPEGIEMLSCRWLVVTGGKTREDVIMTRVKWSKKHC